jgi:hypothetical protein
MKEIDVKTLRQTLKEHQDAAEELNRLDQMEGDARRDMEAATNDDIGKESVQRKISDARITLDLVKSRRKKLAAPTSELSRRLKEQFRAVGNAWNAQLDAIQKEREAQYREATQAFHGGDPTRVFLPPMHVLFPNRQECTFHFPYYPNPEQQDLARDVQLLLAHIARSQKKLGLS